MLDLLRYPRAVARRLDQARARRELSFRKLPPAGHSPLPWRVPCPRNPDGAPVVAVHGFFRKQFGLGQSARLYAAALARAGYRVHAVDAGIPTSHQDAAADLGDIEGDRPLVDLVVVNPDHLDELPLAGGTYRIGLWFWELDVMPPAWHWAVDRVDEIWVASTFVADVVRQATRKPVVVVPHPVGTGGIRNLDDRSAFDLDPRAFTFLFTFDVSSGVARKNPVAVIQAFQQAFPRGRDDVQLLVKSSNGAPDPGQLAPLFVQRDGDARVILRDQVLDAPRFEALQWRADAYVSLHRAEGFGLGMAEMMARGKPVVATAWSGNLDYMDGSSACLVGCTRVPVQPGQYPHAQGATWAEPDIDQAASWMRRLVDDPEFARCIGEGGRQAVQARLGDAAVAAVVHERLWRLSVPASAGPLHGNDGSCSC
jgi:glycosyltransferase involved in cell wall biosynthesis